VKRLARFACFIVAAVVIAFFAAFLELALMDAGVL